MKTKCFSDDAHFTSDISTISLIGRRFKIENTLFRKTNSMILGKLLPIVSPAYLFSYRSDIKYQCAH